MLIAEISSNHNSSLERCIKFVKSASDCGFDAIKLQIFKIDELFTKEVLSASPMHAERRKWEFPLEFLEGISNECKEYGLKLGITPFYIKAVDEAAAFVDFYKVASYELMWVDLHQAIAAKKLPTIVSTGMATLSEIQSIKDLYQSLNFDLTQLTFLHCESNYPADYRTINLSAINTMRDSLGCNIGWSDHTRDVDVICSAIFSYGANTIEMHFDLDGEGDEASGGHCWLPEEVKKLTSKIQKFRDMAGDGVKSPSSVELQERQWRADPSDGLRPTIAIRDNLRL